MRRTTFALIMGLAGATCAGWGSGATAAIPAAVPAGVQGAGQGTAITAAAFRPAAQAPFLAEPGATGVEQAQYYERRRYRRYRRYYGRRYPYRYRY